MEREPEAIVELETELADLEVDAPRVGILMGSRDDAPVMELAERTLRELGIRSETRVLSAHEDPEELTDYVANARMRGLRVLIAGSGLAAWLPAAAAARTELPVIGVPLTSAASVGGGLDALLSVAQSPPGLPIACVGVDNAHNAALLAARILQA